MYVSLYRTYEILNSSYCFFLKKVGAEVFMNFDESAEKISMASKLSFNFAISQNSLPYYKATLMIKYVLQRFVDFAKKKG